MSLCTCRQAISRQDFRRQAPADLQIGLQQGAQAIRIGIEVGDLLQIFDGAIQIPLSNAVRPCQQQCVAIGGIQLAHFVQDLFLFPSMPSSNGVSAAAAKICHASFFLPKRV